MKKPISKTRKPVRATQSPRATAKPVAESAPAKSDTQGDGAKTISEWALELGKDRRGIQKMLHGWPADGKDHRGNDTFLPATVELAVDLENAKREGRVPSGAPAWLREAYNLPNAFDRGAVTATNFAISPMPTIAAETALKLGVDPAMARALYIMLFVEGLKLANFAMRRAGIGEGMAGVIGMKLEFIPPPPATFEQIAKGECLARELVAKD